MSDNIFINPSTPWYKGLYDDDSTGISLATADARYVRNGGNATLSSLEASSITISGSTVLTQSVADGRYLQLSGGSLTGALTVNRGNGETLISTNGTVRTAIHIQASLAHIGTTSAHNFNIQANGANVLQCLSTGNVNVNNSLQISGTGIAIGNNVSSISSDLVIMENASTPQIEIGRSQTNGNSFNIGYTHVGDGNVLNRLFIQPRGASVNDTLTYTVNGGRVGIGSPTPTQKLEVNGNINVSSGNGYMIGGNNIDDRYLRTTADTTSTALVRFYASQAAGAADQTIIRFGHTTASGDWFLRHHNSSGGWVNNCLELLNTNSNLIGFSIGTGNGTSAGDGCMLAISGIQGDSGVGFLKASSVNCNGSVHLNSGIPQSVPANRRYGSSTSDPSNQSGGMVSISLYTYNDIWVRGSMYCTSDRRAKKDIKKAIDIQDECMNLLKKEVEPVWYKWKDTSEAVGVDNLGYIAQNLVLNGITGLIQEFKNEAVKEECLETNTPAGRQLVVDYSKINIYLVEICKKLDERIKKLEKILDEYDIVD